MIPPAFLAIVIAVALLVLIPTRRLYLAGWGTSVLAGYYATMALLAIIAAELRGPARFMIPVLVVGYILPFVSFRRGLARLFGRPAAERRTTDGRPADSPPPRRVGPIDEPPTGSGDARPDDADRRG